MCEDYFSDREITKELMDAINRYEEFDPRNIFINFINDELTNEQVIERFDKAIAEKELISRDDKTFFKANYL
ncbi:MAG: hypothetical protein PF638_05110 [Candidatus Delongbacteria bacterium]|jgi:hypothetical protein|nr:hypothetical protein [Candidatus Delongbacteria bacterium]